MVYPSDFVDEDESPVLTTPIGAEAEPEPEAEESEKDIDDTE